MLDLHGDLEALVAEAQRRVEQRALEREAAAARRASEILEGADADAAQTVKARHDHARVEANALRERLLAVGEMQAQRLMLEHREALLDAVWEETRRRLEAHTRDPSSYLATLRRLAALAARTLACDDIELATEPRGRALLTPERLEAWGREDGVRYRLADAPLEASGGLEASAGRLRFDATFEARLAHAREALREAVAARLLGDAVAGGRGDLAAPDAIEDPEGRPGT
ncbi:MAG: V-type ATP synthase subunit E family protein [Deinococcales bacterium]